MVIAFLRTGIADTLYNDDNCMIYYSRYIQYPLPVIKEDPVLGTGTNRSPSQNQIVVEMSSEYGFVRLVADPTKFQPVCSPMFASFPTTG